MMRLSNWLLVVMLMSLTMCEERGLPRRSAPVGDMIANAKATFQQIEEEFNRVIAQIQLELEMESSDRGCNGFPCMDPVFGYNAANQARMNTQLASGKRRRRSATAQAVLSLLTRDGKRTS